jgi:hypothetical protein
VKEPSVIEKALHFLYERWQFWSAERPGRNKPEEMYPGGYEAPAVARKQRERRR